MEFFNEKVLDNENNRKVQDYLVNAQQHKYIDYYMLDTLKRSMDEKLLMKEFPPAQIFYLRNMPKELFKDFTRMVDNNFGNGNDYNYKEKWDISYNPHQLILRDRETEDFKIENIRIPINELTFALCLYHLDHTDGTRMEIAEIQFGRGCCERHLTLNDKGQFNDFLKKWKNK